VLDDDVERTGVRRAVRFNRKNKTAAAVVKKTVFTVARAARFPGIGCMRVDAIREPVIEVELGYEFIAAIGGVSAANLEVYVYGAAGI
jgi:hypothetical protein